MSDGSFYSFTEMVAKMIPSIIGFIGGFTTAIFAEPLRQVMYRPKLVLEFDKTNDFISKTPYSDKSGTYEAYYVRIKVTNKKPRLAKNCRAYLVNIELQDENKQYVSTEYCDSIPLAWSCRGEQAYTGIDLPNGIAQFIDVISLRSVSGNFNPAINPMPFRYIKLFHMIGVLRFTVQVSGDGITPRFIKINFKWNGIWNEFEVWKD